MAWTSHGHHIPGSIMDGPAPDRARCGGVNLCKLCGVESLRYRINLDAEPQEEAMIDVFEEDPKTDKWEVLENDIRKSINKLSLENEFNIPDYILAQHVVNNLKNLSNTIKLDKERRNG